MTLARSKGRIRLAPLGAILPQKPPKDTALGLGHFVVSLQIAAGAQPAGMIQITPFTTFSG
jgi:hypothetical protein